jgi:hypothetical protein
MFRWLNKPTLILAAVLAVVYSIYIIATAAVTTPDGMATNIDMTAFVLPIALIMLISSILGTIIHNRRSADRT